jgi:RNA polymerase sigma-70 factor, ECF subfamily
MWYCAGVNVDRGEAAMSDAATPDFPENLEDIFPVVFGELRRLASRFMRKERACESLQATALVNEAYLKLRAGEHGRFESRAHFFHIAGRIMRQVLVDHARAKLTLKRGQRPKFEEVPALALAVVQTDPDVVVALNEVLTRLEAVDARRSRIVELKCFAGLSNEEVAETLNVSVSSVKRDWNFAKAWLRREFTQHKQFEPAVKPSTQA